MGIEDFEGTVPEFLPEHFFAGKLEGWAVFESLVGGLQKRASITATGTIDEGTGSVLFVETYEFDDGHSDTLHWTIRKLGPGRYSGLENRLDGEAKGEQAGCAFHWQYTRETPQADGSTAKLNYDDWFYAIDGKACMVRGSAGRAGVPFARRLVMSVGILLIVESERPSMLVNEIAVFAIGILAFRMTAPLAPKGFLSGCTDTIHPVRWGLNRRSAASA
jgi:hypothetical protein